MKEVIFNKKNYRSYEDLYSQIYQEFNAKKNAEWEQYENFNYHPDILYEFLRDYLFVHKNINFIFLNFNKNEIKNNKSNDDYNYNIVFNIFKDLMKEFSNINIDFQNDNR